jgi:3-methyladenine DNA glycosylase AlkC
LADPRTGRNGRTKEEREGDDVGGSSHLERLRARTGAPRIAAIPKDVLDALNSGAIETRNLVEWLAIDPRKLLGAILPGIGLARETPSILADVDAVASEGVSRRTKRIGAILHDVLRTHARRAAIFEKLAAHGSDVVRSLAAYALSHDASLDLPRRLAATRRFAADPHMSVREAAWDSMRPHLVLDLEPAIRLLRAWVRDRDANVRRCAIEATRPRGVWTAHVEALKKDPEPARPLLEPVRSDESLYVRNAVGNWLNDASKSRPDWVRRLCARWTRESRTPETAHVVRRALRTLRKRGGGEE